MSLQYPDILDMNKISADLRGSGHMKRRLADLDRLRMSYRLFLSIL